MKMSDFIASAFDWNKNEKWIRVVLGLEVPRRAPKRRQRRRRRRFVDFFFLNLLCYLSPIDSRRLFNFISFSTEIRGTGESRIDFLLKMCLTTRKEREKKFSLCAATFYDSASSWHRSSRIFKWETWVADADVGRLSGTNWLPFFICFRERRRGSFSLSSATEERSRV